MKCKLYKETNQDYSTLQQLLYNRGISLEEQNHWLNAGWDDINDWWLLGEGNIRAGCKLLHKHIENNSNIVVIVDSDADGFHSAAIIINYIYSVGKVKCDFVMHDGKQHGFNDVLDELIEKKPNLVLCPDAGSNDTEAQKTLHDLGVDLIILDHHIIEETDEPHYGIIINNQDCDYPDKELTGSGVTWQFCRGYDYLYGGFDAANDYIDLATLGCIGDMADYHSLEIRALCNIGLKNMKSEFVKDICCKREYSFNKMNGINYYSIAFYYIPLINSLCRSGTMDEKRLVFRALLETDYCISVPSSKRGEKGLKVNLSQEAITVAERVKRRQTQVQDEAIEVLSAQVEKDNLLDDAILLFLLEQGEVDPNVAGLIANRAQAKYQRPCLILTRNGDYYQGSGRNYSLSPVQDLKAELERTGKVEWVRGHSNAFGVCIAEDNITDFLEAFDDQYDDIDQTPVYWVDYIWSQKSIQPDRILDIGRMNIYGQGLPESLICVDYINLDDAKVTLMGEAKGNPTIKIEINGVSFIKFKASRDEYNYLTSGNVHMKLVGKCAVNEWNGNISPQVLIEDYELWEDWVF